jgi:hypothetical protein
LLKASTSLALTKPFQNGGTLVASFAPIVSSSTSFGMVRNDFFSTDDELSLTVHQPLRVERAQMNLFTAGTNPGTNAAALQQREISLTPSGREIAFELGYGGSVGAWRAQFNIAYRHDAGHVTSKKSGAAMLWLSRVL